MYDLMLLCVSIWLLCIVNVNYGLQSVNIRTLLHRPLWPACDTSNKTLHCGDTEVLVATEDCNNFQNCISKVCDGIQGNVDGFVLYVDCVTAAVLDNVSIFRHVPTIVITKDMCEYDLRNLISLQPSCELSNSLVADLVAREQLKNVMLYFDHRFNSRCLTDLIRKLSLKSTRTRLVNIAKYTSVNEYIELASVYQPEGVIFIASRDVIENTINQADLKEVPDIPWILVTGSTTLPNVKLQYDRQCGVYFPRPWNQTHDGNLCSNVTECAEITGIHEKSMMFFANLYNNASTFMDLSFLEQLSCSIKTPVPNRDKVVETFKEMNTALNTDSTTFEVCKLSSSSESWQQFGKWSKDSNNLPPAKKSLTYDNVDFKNATMRVAVVEMPPYVVFNRDPISNHTTYTGFCIDILNQLAHSFNFNYQVVSPADNGYGSPRPDGTWNGMIGMILAKEADFAAGPFTITAVRGTVIDFTKPFYEDGVGILTKRPTTEKNKAYKMFKPLSVEVWVVTGLAIMIVGVLLFIVNRFSPYSSSDEDHQNTLDRGSLSSAMWIIYGAFVEQGAEEPRPRATSGRVMLSFWWVFTILMLSTYTANLAAYLTVTIIPSPINSLEELANQNEIRPLVFAGSNLYTLFQTSKSQSRRLIWDQMSDMPDVNKIDEVLDLVRLNQFAFMSDYSYIEYQMLQDCQTFAMADDKFNNAGLGFALPKNSKFLQAFDFAIMKMTEGGFIERWIKKWWPRTNSCSGLDRSSSAHALGLDSLSGLFVMYLGVIGVSLVVFIVENIARTQRVRKIVDNLHNKVNKIKQKRSSLAEGVTPGRRSDARQTE